MQKRYVLDWSAITTKEIKSSSCYWVTSPCTPNFDFDEEEIIEKAEDAVGESFSTTFIAELAEKGYNIQILSIDNVKAELIKRYKQRPYGRFQQERWAYAKLRVQATITFTSDKEIMGSPIAPAIIVAIGKALFWIILALGAIFVAMQVVNWLNSMTTEKWEITEIWYDEEGNIIREKREKGEKPAISGMITLGIIAIILFAVFMFFRGKK